MIKWLSVTAVAIALGGILIAVGCGSNAPGKQGIVHKSEMVPIPRAMIIAARGKSVGIYKRVRELERAACAEHRLTKEQCAEGEKLEAEQQRNDREIAAVLAVPDYEVDWSKLVDTLERVGRILDMLPIP